MIKINTKQRTKQITTSITQLGHYAKYGKQLRKSMKFSKRKFEKFLGLKKGDIASLESIISKMPSKKAVKEIIHRINAAFDLAKRLSEIRSGEYVEDESTPSLRAVRRNNDNQKTS